jgi:hypothetical protein
MMQHTQKRNKEDIVPTASVLEGTFLSFKFMDGGISQSPQ